MTDDDPTFREEILHVAEAETDVGRPARSDDPCGVSRVLAALYELLRGFQAANDHSRDELLRDLRMNPDLVHGYWFWGRPTAEELCQDFRETTRRIRPDWEAPRDDLAPAGGLFPPTRRCLGGRVASNAVAAKGPCQAAG